MSKVRKDSCVIMGCSRCCDHHSSLCHEHMLMKRKVRNKIYRGAPLTASEQAFLAQVPSRDVPQMGAFCSVCFDLPWRRPARGACQCGGIFAEEESEE